MTFIKKLTEKLKFEEGFELMPYKDTVGKLTIGIGRCLDERGITMEEAEFILKTDIVIVMTELNDSFSWWTNLSEERQLIMCDLAFNLGLPKLKKFVKFLEAMEKAEWIKAHDELLDSNYADQVPNRAKRNAEAILER
jgi:lysozyme